MVKIEVFGKLFWRFLMKRLKENQMKVLEKLLQLEIFQFFC
jgi:serine kinase of HPr protein (carbohydrate metabolism regulator)